MDLNNDENCPDREYHLNDECVRSIVDDIVMIFSMDVRRDFRLNFDQLQMWT